MSARLAVYLRQNLLGLVAIFLALTAGAYAVQKAPKNSVVGKSIKKGSVKSSDIGDGKVTGADVDESSLAGVPGANGGTVTSVGSGAGLAGGPITGSGNLALESCPNGQLLKSTGSDYACDTDDNAGGDITSVVTAAGSGLEGGGANGAVNLSLPDCGQFATMRADSPVSWACSFNHWGTLGSGVPPTVNVAGREIVALQAGVPTEVTGLTGGVDGQRVTLVATNANATLEDGGATIFLSADWNPNDDDTLTLVSGSGDWYEVARSDNSP